MIRILPDSHLTITRHKLQTQIATTDAEIRTGALPVMEGYKALLQQLFDNILRMHLKFQKPSNKPVEMINAGDCSRNALTNMYASPDTHYKWISFEDNGIGFDPQYSSRIFDLFEKLNRHDEYPGNGIGLSICRKIMELHQGFIEADSEPGKGQQGHLLFSREPAHSIIQEYCTRKAHPRSPCRRAYTLLNTSALLQEDLSYGFVTGIEDIDASIFSNSDIR